MSDDQTDLQARGAGSMLSRLRHPWLFGIAALAFVIDLFIPDMVPFVDEIVLAAITAAFGLWRKKRRPDSDDT